MIKTRFHQGTLKRKNTQSIYILKQFPGGQKHNTLQNTKFKRIKTAKKLKLKGYTVDKLDCLLWDRQ